ncbi:MAG: hypothetical protein E7B12_16170 [Clostridioides difficile]|uniref:hypothetical protein n=2 Tax=Clostridium TaxID=1485 RepID=UPI0015D4FDF0|nr:MULTISPECIES: hypothetical protein [Clostridium]MDU2057639.1 hypothetical protein [Clostridioides difficile]MDU2961826.1 hypothetical protein [Clostridioides difficile]MDU3116770.1 hypothetical protein [Clostridioides difficile]
MVKIFFTNEQKVVVLVMLDTMFIGSVVIILINMILKHNKDFSLRLRVKILGLDIEIKSKEKKHPSDQD